MKRVITANSNHCCIYDYHHKMKQLTLVKEIDHPENRLKMSELVSDRSGHYNTSHTNRGAYGQTTNTTTVHIDNFAREVARELEKERNHHDYTELVLIMPPDMEGMLLHHLNKHVKALIKQNIQKNVMNVHPHELLTYLNEHVIPEKKRLH